MRMTRDVVATHLDGAGLAVIRCGVPLPPRDLPSARGSEATASPNPSGATPVDDLVDTAAAERQKTLRKDYLTDVRRAAVLARIGALVWPLFVIYDLLQSLVLREGDVYVLLALRAMPEPVLLYASWRMARAPTITEERFHALVRVAMLTFSTTLALMCIATTGFTSIYIAGNMLMPIAVVFAPRRFPLAAREIFLCLLPHPLLLFGSTFVLPRMHAQLSDPYVLGTVTQHAFVGVSLGLAIAAFSHVFWQMRNEIHESKSIGRYKLRRLLGKGGMSEVWAAYHVGLRREVAVKILEPKAELDEAARRRFEREVRATASLTHPNTVRVFDYGATEDGLLYYAMELLPGETLSAFVRRRGALPIGRAVHLARQAAQALGEAHARGIVHRDVKPENLFVTSAGGEPDFVKVLDFGIATILEDDHVTHTESVAGSATTMSPEVILGHPATPASDVYALGAVLYALVAGVLPFHSSVRSAMLVAHVSSTPVPPSVRRCEAIDPALERLILRCLSKVPTDRPVDARHVAEELDVIATRFPWIPRRDAAADDERIAMHRDARTRGARDVASDPVASDAETRRPRQIA